MSNKMPLSDKAHDQILEMVVKAGVRSDELLFTEDALAKSLGMSKAPIREALLKLCCEGVLKSIPRCGYVIVRIGEKGGRDIRQVRTLLEMGAFDLYSGKITPEQVGAVRAQLESARANVEGSSIWDIWEYNMEFHCLLCSFTGNAFMEKQLRECIAAEKRFYAQNHWHDCEQKGTIFDPEAHERICRALETGDIQTARRLLNEDISMI